MRMETSLWTPQMRIQRNGRMRSVPGSLEIDCGWWTQQGYSPDGFGGAPVWMKKEWLYHKTCSSLKLIFIPPHLRDRQQHSHSTSWMSFPLIHWSAKQRHYHFSQSCEGLQIVSSLCLLRYVLASICFPQFKTCLLAECIRRLHEMLSPMAKFK